MWTQARDRLAGTITSLGFPEEFADLLAKQLGSPKAIDRLTSYLYQAKPRSMEMIIDEMLAIRAEIDAWRERKESLEAQEGYSRWLNSETRRRNEEE
jgi:hypothetical protein